MADLLINACRDLALMPFDSAKKSFDARHLSELIDASDAIRSACVSGKVFAAETERLPDGDYTKQGTLRLLRDDFLSHCEDMRKTGFFPKAYLESARVVVEEAAQNGRLSHPVEGSAVSHVILAGELSSLCNRDLRQPSAFSAFRTALFQRLGLPHRDSPAHR